MNDLTVLTANPYDESIEQHTHLSSSFVFQYYEKEHDINTDAVLVNE
jgi:hypothetical protein